jgi:hypothetical protein
VKVKGRFALCSVNILDTWHNQIEIIIHFPIKISHALLRRPLQTLIFQRSSSALGWEQLEDPMSRPIKAPHTMKRNDIPAAPFSQQQLSSSTQDGFK